MIQTYDVGSLPFTGQWATFLRGARITPFLEALHPAKNGGDKEYFDARVTESFLDKVRAGVDVPNYPQFRDMNEMFLNAIDGIVKTGDGYVVRDSPSITREKLLIPEVHVLRDRSRHIRELLGDPVRIKICVTGPYTLSTFFAPGRKGLFKLLGDAVAKMVEHNIFSNKFGGVVLVTVDEPVFGFLDDPSLDYGAEGREELLAAWEQIFYHVKAKGCQSGIHLHNTSNELFWQIRSVDIIESHVNDPLYATPRTRRFLEEEDKVLKASIAVTVFDSLIRNSLPTREKMTEAVLNQQVADIWTAIRRETRNPIDFLESVQTIRGRLKTLLRRFGETRMPYAGPECGLRSFPTYSTALECLRRVASAVEDVNQGVAG
jgi:5-methyltetrahydropteroyltriglutamate--homocysteine methyltransferase